MSLPFGYTGEQEDAESGLVYLRARYLDPATGRFLTRDPLAGIPGWRGSGYAYAEQNPTLLTDPAGLWPHIPSSVIIGLAVVGMVATAPVSVPSSAAVAAVVVVGTPLAIVAGHAIGTAIYEARHPEPQPLLSRSEQKYLDWKARQLGIPREALRKAIEDIKHEESLGPKQNVTIDDDGTVRYNGEEVGNVFDEPGVRKAMKDAGCPED